MLFKYFKHYPKWSDEVDLREVDLPLWLWNPEEMSPEIQNRNTSGPKIGNVNVSTKNIKKNAVMNVMAKNAYFSSFSKNIIFGLFLKNCEVG